MALYPTIASLNIKSSDLFHSTMAIIAVSRHMLNKFLTVDTPTS
jgi:hypothetical protein